MRALPLVFVVALALGISVPAHAEEFDSKGVRLHYVVEGKGEPVVLIHGLGGSVATNWKLPGVVDRLAQEYQVIGLDCPGHGKSEKPEADEFYGEEMVEHVIRLLDHLEIDKAHVAGYSMGGIIALKMVVKHPARVRSVVLGGMGMLRAGGLLEKVFENMGRDGGRVPAACPRGFSRLSVTEEEVKAIRVPVTVIVGDRDPCKRMYVQPLKELRPDVTVHVIEGAGHLTCVAKPEFKDLLQRALDAVAHPPKERK